MQKSFSLSAVLRIVQILRKSASATVTGLTLLIGLSAVIWIGAHGLWVIPIPDPDASENPSVDAPPPSDDPVFSPNALPAETAFTAQPNSPPNISAGAVAFFSVALLFLGSAGTVIALKMSARREHEEEVRQIYRAATDAAKEGFYMLRPIHDAWGKLIDFQFEDVNRRGGFLLGTERHHLLGKPASKVLHPLVFSDLLDLIQNALTYHAAEDERRVAALVKLPSRWLYRRAVTVGTGVALTLRDISENKAHEEALIELAHRDALTGLPNRAWLQRYLPKALRQAHYAHKELAILFIDLDHFKLVNDSLGHDAGDALLKEVTARLRSVVRASDHVIRLGGDEFLVVIENVDKPDIVDDLARKIIGNLNQRFSPMGGALSKVSASIGISLFPRDGTSPEELLKHADLAMYQSKAYGRGRVCWYRPEFTSQLTEFLNNEQALRQAIQQKELVVHYQPKFDTLSRQLNGVEALVRWQRPGHGLEAPSTFIALAEQTGLIVAVGEQVIQQVVGQMALWQQSNLPTLRVAINVSPEQLRRTDVASYLQQQLEIHRVDPQLLDIEITESGVVDQSDAVQAQLKRLRTQGVRLVIDDFGAGYSSLSQLQMLDVDGLKMDRGLVAPLTANSDAESLCRAIVRMASALDLEVVAEGVETMEQLISLRNIGSDVLQGFLLARPMSAESLEHFLSRQQPLPLW